MLSVKVEARRRIQTALGSQLGITPHIKTKRNEETKGKLCLGSGAGYTDDKVRVLNFLRLII
jgi:hypothetical protein